LETTTVTDGVGRAGDVRVTGSGDDGRPPALAATVHDPGGHLLPALEARAGALAWYRAAYVCATEATDPRLVAALRAVNATVEWQPNGVAGSGRLRSIALALQDRHSRVLYVDLDRWLHWLGSFPDELRVLPQRIAAAAPEAWYICLSRTERAFATHPEVQRVAERATNRALELVIGREIDATAGGSWLTAAGAGLLVAQSTERTLGTDLEWPALVWRHDPSRLAAIAVEGLEFESAAFAAAAIAAAGGLEAWIARTYQTPGMWRQRLQLAADSIAALDRALAR
jgi:hypothetical protein